jgi:hypothetical protein
MDSRATSQDIIEMSHIKLAALEVRTKYRKIRRERSSPNLGEQIHIPPREVLDPDECQLLDEYFGHPDWDKVPVLERFFGLNVSYAGPPSKEKSEALKQTLNRFWDAEKDYFKSNPGVPRFQGPKPEKILNKEQMVLFDEYVENYDQYHDRYFYTCVNIPLEPETSVPWWRKLWEVVSSLSGRIKQKPVNEASEND